ncbi:hypothetical protein [Conexibacter sp. SYSU D00693]|uniref:hypothetical protein n=1 Tax=Conexibacter sp. SYSU D00693 TaxID=2812560 RepID=UPI00196A68BC|nr:hypothetical protein [Conexibacter sp. SYSU D00693]
MIRGAPRERSHLLKVVGHGRGPAPDRWLEEGWERVLRRSGFPRRPRVVPGDRLVLYAAVWQRLFGVVEVVGEPELDDGGADPVRWPWSVPVEPLLVVPVLDAAPPLQACGVAPRSMSQQSHVRITAEQYERAVDALSSVAR